MSTPKAAVFDLGKVLVDFDYAVTARRIGERCQTPVDDAKFFDQHGPLLFRYEIGQVSAVEFFNHMCSATGFSGTEQDFRSYFDIFTPIQPMVELHAALRARGYPTFIFSNTNDVAIEHIARTCAFYGNFDGYILSYEHGAMKPDPKLYEVVERQTGCRGGEIVYIDDRPENIATGIQRGWHSILHECPDRTRVAVERLGLLNGR